MAKLRTLIIDDEPLARDRLRGMLAKEATIEILGECGSGPEAIAGSSIRGSAKRCRRVTSSTPTMPSIAAISSGVPMRPIGCSDTNLA